MIQKNRLGIVMSDFVHLLKTKDLKATPQRLCVLKELDKKSFEKGIEVKRRHYNSLKHKVEDFSKELDRLSDTKYNDKSGKIKNFLWWELI